MNRIVITIMLGLFVCLIPDASAFKCIDKGLPVNYTSSKYVFSAYIYTATNLGETELKIPSPGGGSTISENRIEIIKSYKGGLEGDTYIFSANGLGDIFKEDNEYLVFADELDDYVVVKHCSGVKLLSAVIEIEYKQLGQLGAIKLLGR